MAERIWTPAQREAITCASPDILVSAAAGSGKTAVLTKRILDKLTDEEHPADISRMLIVTFTKAAAGELKERIAKTLSTAMAEQPGNKRLKRQYILLSKAKITTIHGFCLDLIKQNFQELGLSPSVSVSDEAQSALLMQQVADVVIDQYYAGLPGYDDIPDFVSFADNFITLQDDSLSRILLSLYEKVSSYPRGIHFIADSAAEFEKAEEHGLFATVWGEEILTHMTEVLRYYQAILKAACDYLDEETYRDKYYPSFLNEYGFAADLLKVLDDRNVPQIRELLFSHQSVPLKALKRELQTEECRFFRDKRKEFLDAITKLTTAYFSDSPEVIRRTAAESRRFLEDLHRFLCAFDRKYRYEKKIRGLLDFNDLERLACQLLVTDEGKPTPLAHSVSEQYDEIYIDEYQDVNKIQDLIFSAIARHSNRFMVGDIKQSVYGFRGAEPSLFADYRQNDAVKKVYLSHNFRCDRPIIDFVNQICGTLFTCAGKTVPYDETDMLVCGKGGDGEHGVELALIDAEGKRAAERRALEASYVADRIATLLKEGAKPGDICILLRSASRSSPIFEEALTKRGIPCQNRVVKDLFVNPEILLILNLLHVIDNPSRDIYLAGALKSPVFNFSLSELALLRRHHPEGSLFDAIRRFTEETDHPKGRYFLQKLEEYRVLAARPVDELIWHLLTDTGILALGDDDGQDPETVRANLLTLYDHARRFENGSFKGLYHFLKYIHDVLDSGSGFDSAPASADADKAVRIMTIHQSKGLEFPVVFLCDCGSDFNDSDKSERVLIDRHYGVTLKLSDSTGLASIDTVFRRAEGLGISRKGCEEEIRVLYVALTRAIHRLIVTGATANAEGLLTDCALLSRLATPETGYLFRENNNFLSWILVVAGDTYAPRRIRVTEEDVTEAATAASEAPPAVNDPATVEEMAAILRERFAYRYSNALAAELPAKLSVSELYPTILDEYDDAVKLSDNRQNRMRTPRFLQNARDSAADRGTATHQFMQFCELSRLTPETIEDEIAWLVEARYLDSHTASLVDRYALKRFTETPFCQELKVASDLRRELRFNVRLPATAFSEDPDVKASLEGETILVQGVMDGVFTDRDGKLTLFDYKTDRIPAELRGDPDGFARLLIQRHRQQLSYYRAACSAVMCRPVERVLIYSFALNRAVTVSDTDLISL